MAIQQGLTNSFKQDMVNGQQSLLYDSLWIALYTSFATLGPNTVYYGVPNEVLGGATTGYENGGQELINVTVNTDTVTGIVYVNFGNVVWNSVNFTARGALIYNKTQGDRSVAVLDFGSDKTATNTFTITMPVNSPTTALLRFT